MAKRQTITEDQLIKENRELKLRLREAEETLDAIRNGEVDAIVVSGSGSEKVFSLTSAETPYRYLVENMKEGAVTLSADGLVLYCNGSFEELVSIPMEQIVGTSFRKFINKDDWPLYDNLLLLSRERKKEEILFYPCNDEPKYLHLSFYPIPEGELGKICVIVSDVTDLKKFEHDLQMLVDERTTDLKKAIKQLNEAIATKDKLFSIIAHDLRGPFTALLGFSEMLAGNARKYDTGQFEMMINNIHAAAKSAYTLMENLLLWTLAQTEQIQYNPEKLHLSNTVREAIRTLKPSASLKNISVEFSATGDPIAYADANMINVILQNLISNAIKYTYSGGKIHVCAKSNNQFAEVTVSDTGIGMSKDKIKSLLAIDKLNTTRGTDDEKGTGLGLLICKEFIHKHGGHLLIQSEAGQGSSFTFIIPNETTSVIPENRLADKAGSK